MGSNSSCSASWKSVRRFGSRGPRAARQLAAHYVPLDGNLSQGFADLHDQLVGRQSSWASFAQDAERALRAWANAVATLTSAIEKAEAPLRLGTIDVVIDDEYVLMAPPDDLMARQLVPLSDPTNAIAVTGDLAAQLEDPDAHPDSVFRHPLVARQLRYQRAAAEQAEALRDKKRATQAMNAGRRPGG